MVCHYLCRRIFLFVVNMKYVSVIVSAFVGCCGVILAYCSLGTFANDSPQPVQDDVKEIRRLEFSAVRSIHVHLDDDNDGDVDLMESKEFLQHELNMQDNKRHSKFHSGDGSISVDELWKAWLNNEVSKWTPDEVADWLTNIVHLPQYADIFKDKQINGRDLPRLASADNGILLNELKISNVYDRKKIALRAMDVVLFGAPRGHNYLKDIVLGLAVLIAMAGFWFSTVQKRNAQKQMETMMKDIQCLQDAEKNLTRLQNRLHEAEASQKVIQQEKYQLESNMKNEIETAKREAQRLREAREDQSEEIHTRLKLAEQELVQVREALRNAEKEVEYFSSQMTSSLQKLLQITYQKEVKNFILRRSGALKKMQSAKEACDRINRKRYSLFGSLRLVHDQNIDEVDRRILAARSSLAEVTNELEELQHRWQQIEACCRLDLGLSSSFINDSLDSSSNLDHTFAVYGKFGSLGSAKSHSPEALHRVYTCPSFQSLGDSPPSYQTISQSKVVRQTSDPSFTSQKVAVEKFGHETGISQNDCESECGMIQVQTDGSWSECKDSTCNRQSDCDVSMGQKKDFMIGQKETVNMNASGSTKSKKNGSEIEIAEDIKSRKRSLNSEQKSFFHKKKWWSRNKRHYSLETDSDFEREVLEDHGGSLSVLTQLKGSYKNLHDDNTKSSLTAT